MPPCLDAGRPSDPGQGVDQRAALDAEGATDRGLGGAAVEGGDHRPELLGIDDGGAAAPAAPAAGPPPPRGPGRGPATSPACTRSWISDRSNCASAPKT